MTTEGTSSTAARHTHHPTDRAMWRRDVIKRLDHEGTIPEFSAATRPASRASFPRVETVGVMEADTTFLVSKATNNPDRLFLGYCFAGRDYIHGSSGAEAYTKHTGNTIEAGEDGCYITGVRVGSRHRLATDYWGYKKLFYFHDREFWAVSNSILRLVQHLRERGIRVLPNYAQLAAMTGGTPTRQLSSFATPADGVHLLPPDCSLEIGDDKAILHREVRARGRGDYRERLSEFAETWISRIETLLVHSRMRLSSDLTGGMDSRCVFALLLHALHRLGGQQEAALRVNCGAIKGDMRDLKIATRICARYGTPLNSELLPAMRRTGLEAYSAWKHLCLGQYGPVYFPNASMDPELVCLMGGGGENVRRFYPDESIDAFAARCASSITVPWLRHQFTDDIFRAMEYIRGSQPVHNDLILHYTYFRSRFHAGRAPQYRTVFNPLGSRLLAETAEAAGFERVDVSQLHYDIMSTQPDLLRIPFGDPSAAPSARVLSGLTDISVSQQPNPGKVFIDPPTSHEPSGDSAAPLVCFQREFRAARANSFVRDFLGEPYLQKADTALTAAVANGRFRHANDGQPAGVALAALALAGSFRDQ